MLLLCRLPVKISRMIYFYYGITVLMGIKLQVVVNFGDY